jgi:hypothetical protein
MESIWARQTDLGVGRDELREEMQLHLARHIGPCEPAFIDHDGWAGSSKEAGPPVDVLVAPPQGERRFAYVTSFGASLMRVASAVAADAPGRVEFSLAAPQSGEPASDRAMLNLAANTVRQFAKLVHLQPVRVELGDTVAFSDDPRSVFEGSEQVAFVFMRPRLPADGFESLALPGGERLRLVSPVPIYREELDAGHTGGGSRLVEALLKGGVTEMLDLSRPGVVRQAPPPRASWLRRFAGLFGFGRPR